jgi:hypothetical protein
MLAACHHKKVEPTPQVDSIAVDKVIKADLDSMTAKYGDKDFRWYESLILLEDFMDSVADMKVAELVNIYQVVDDGDVHVYKTQHLSDGTVITDSIHSFWIEDYPLNYNDLKISYAKACELVSQVNLPKPHSRHICLRLSIGPQDCNPQWIFGNTESQIWIDAVSGDARDSDPSFPDNLKKPLGEWP